MALQQKKWRKDCYSLFNSRLLPCTPSYITTLVLSCPVTTTFSKSGPYSCVSPCHMMTYDAGSTLSLKYIALQHQDNILPAEPQNFFQQIHHDSSGSSYIMSGHSTYSSTTLTASTFTKTVSLAMTQT